MNLNHCLRLMLFVAIFLSALQVSAQRPECKDTAEHRRLQEAMWTACGQDSARLVYSACTAFLHHAREDNDIEAANSSWVCGIMYNLGRMNIHDAYHIAQIMKADNSNYKDQELGQYFISNMMGHVYNTCGNIPGAQAEFLKSAELIKGTDLEVDGLPFVYIALAHVHLNNDLEQTLHWLSVAKQVLDEHQDSWNYYRALSDVYAMKAIVRFKQKDFKGFRQCIALMNEAESKNRIPAGDIFTPYARIYETLLNGDVEKALADADALQSLKEEYLVKCDIYRYIGDDDNAFLIQRELMHKRDSITGVMIDENIRQQEEELQLIRAEQKTTRRMNIVLVVVLVLALLFIILLHRNIFLRRRYSKKLKAKNEELRAAYKQVRAADEMKTEFIRSVSHEIRTPLNIIYGFTQVLTTDGNNFGPQENQEIATTIGENTRKITSLVNKMLALANESSKDLMREVEDTDALDVCRRAIAAMPNVNADKIKVIFDDLTGGDGMLCTNGDSLSQMLDNLLENAVKFTEQGYIKLSLRKDGGNMLFTLEDTGCGIPADKVDTIFDRFMKVDEFKEGLGLGLAYCRETAIKLGGNLKLDHTSEKGTAFTLSLPIKLNLNKT